MGLPTVGAVFGRLLARLHRPRRAPGVGGTDVADARLLADAERASGAAPDGCGWLDERTVSDLDLPLVFRTIDRTTTPTGAQALWRWLVAPARQLDVVTHRERRLAQLTDPALRLRVRRALAVGEPAPHVPSLLWESTYTPASRRLVVLAIALVSAIVVALWWPIMFLGVMALFGANVLVDDWTNLRLSYQGRALEALGHVLATAGRLIDRRLLPPDVAAALAADLAPLARLRRRIGFLAANDPFGVLEFLRAGLLIRPIALTRCMGIVDSERERLRRIVLAVGEVDALVSVATLRAERRDARVPDLGPGRPRIIARDLSHPAIEGAIGNDLELEHSSLLVTGSNMSGKSTFLRTIAVNAILAQSIHTTFGGWRASLLRVHAAMRISDDTAAGLSTYAAEIEAIGGLVAAASTADDELAALFVIDEPFSGTNPALRVPIVTSVLDFLAERDLVVAATHDLDVAAQVAPRFARGFFCEHDDELDVFDFKLRLGVASSSNALVLLERAGYPARIVRDIHRRVHADPRVARMHLRR